MRMLILSLFILIITSCQDNQQLVDSAQDEVPSSILENESLELREGEYTENDCLRNIITFQRRNDEGCCVYGLQFPHWRPNIRIEVDGDQIYDSGDPKQTHSPAAITVCDEQKEVVIFINGVECRPRKLICKEEDCCSGVEHNVVIERTEDDCCLVTFDTEIAHELENCPIFTGTYLRGTNVGRKQVKLCGQEDILILETYSYDPDRLGVMPCLYKHITGNHCLK